MCTMTRNLAAFMLIVGLSIGSQTQVAGQDAGGFDIQALRNLDEAIRNSESLLSKYPQGAFTANVMFQLSELYLKRAALRFQREMLIYEQAEEKYNNGELTKPPEAPTVDFSETIDISLKLLAQYPDANFRDKILYRVALCYSEEGQQENAAEYFKLLSTETQEKALLEEAYFRLGEYYFDKKEHATAIDYYNLLIESWDSPFFDMALYKLGWSYYNVEDYSKAISTFIYLIEDVNLLDDVGNSNLGKSKTDLRHEAIKYVAICFAEFGGSGRARDFLLPKKEKDYAREVLVHLALLYRQRNYYDEAIETLHTLIEFYPDQPAAAKYQKQIVENYELAGDKTRADMEREVLIELYGPGSKWLAQIPAGETRDEILDIAETFLYTLGSEAQDRAQATSDSVEYAAAIEWYSDYMQKFAEFPRAQNVQFYLGECYYETGKFDKAADAYYDLLIEYPESEFGETAAYNRILAYNHLYSKNAAVDTADFFLFNFLGKSKEGVAILKARSRRQAQLMQACNDFYIYYPRSEKVNEVLMSLAQMLFELEQFDLAKEAYAEVMLEPAGNPFLTKAYYLTAQCEFSQGNYTAAESWWQQLQEMFPDSTQYIERANKMIASSKFRRAEQYLASGDSLQAAREFVRVAETAPDSTIAERALFKAAEQYEQLGKTELAVSHYERMLKQYPQSKLVDEALFKAGILCEDQQNWQRAAANYLSIYRHDRFSNYADRSLFAAARCHETAKEYGQARKLYGEYTETYVQDPERFIEAAFRKAEIAFYLNNFEAAKDDLEFVISSHEKFSKQKIQVDDYFVANAQYLLAEISFERFEKIQLKPPLERTLRKKQQLFQQVVKDYADAAKYRVADWTTASSFKIGQTFEAFADALLASPRPKNLSADDLDKYNETLWQRVLPFKEKAKKAYESNLKNARENGIRNQWILQSEKRLNELNIELGLSTTNMSGDPGL